MPVDRFLDVLADHQADLDEIVEKHAAEHANRLWELLSNPAERNEELWVDALEDMGIEAGLLDMSLQELAAGDRKDLMWGIYSAALIAIASMDAALDEVIPRTVAAADLHADVTHREAGKLNQSQLKEAAVTGVDGTRIEAARERRANASTNRLP